MFPQNNEKEICLFWTHKIMIINLIVVTSYDPFSI